MFMNCELKMCTVSWIRDFYTVKMTLKLSLSKPILKDLLAPSLTNFSLLDSVQGAESKAKFIWPKLNGHIWENKLACQKLGSWTGTRLGVQKLNGAQYRHTKRKSHTTHPNLCARTRLPSSPLWCRCISLSQPVLKMQGDCSSRG